MGRATGAEIHIRDLDQTDSAGELLLAAIREICQLGCLGIPGTDGEVGPDGAVGGVFEKSEGLLIELSVEIDGDVVLTHVKTHVAATVVPVGETGENMLAGMILHTLQAKFGIQKAFDFLSDGKRLGQTVKNQSVSVLHVQNLEIAQKALVRLLAAAFGEEGCLVEGDKEVFSVALTGENLCLKLEAVTVEVEETNGRRKRRRICGRRDRRSRQEL